MSRARRRRDPAPHWNIRAVMRARGIKSSRALTRRLVTYTDISEDQVRRFVAGTARRPPSFDVLDALCYVLRCGIADLIPIDHRKFDPTALAAGVSLAQPKRSKAPKRGSVTRSKVKPLGDPTGVLPFPIEF